MINTLEETNFWKMKNAKSSEFSIKSIMEDTLPKQGAPSLSDQLSTAGAALPLVRNNMAANQLMFNMALSSFHEKFIETLRHRSMLYNTNHPAFAGALSSSLPGFVAQQNLETPRQPRLEFLRECQNQPWLASSPKRHHSSLPHLGKLPILNINRHCKRVKSHHNMREITSQTC